MTIDEIRKALLEAPASTKEVRTNDGRVFLVDAIEQWALGIGSLVIMDGPQRVLNVLSVRNVASIGIHSGPALQSSA